MRTFLASNKYATSLKIDSFLIIISDLRIGYLQREIALWPPLYNQSMFIMCDGHAVGSHVCRQKVVEYFLGHSGETRPQFNTVRIQFQNTLQISVSQGMFYIQNFSMLLLNRTRYILIHSFEIWNLKIFVKFLFPLKGISGLNFPDFNSRRPKE